MRREIVSVLVGVAGVLGCSSQGSVLEKLEPVDAGAGGNGNCGTGGTMTAGNTSAGGTPQVPTPSGCTASCCPTDPSCYSTPQGQHAPGAECLAVRDNTGQGHIQMRQTWIREVTPKGETIPIVYGTLNQYTTLNDPSCATPNGTSGFIHVLDFDLSRHRTLRGIRFARGSRLTSPTRRPQNRTAFAWPSSAHRVGKALRRTMAY